MFGALKDPLVNYPDVALHRSRTGTDGALTMQVMAAGCWHRRTPNLSHTACGLQIHSQFMPLRREDLCDPLCLICFTEFEIARAKEHAVKQGGP